MMRKLNIYRILLPPLFGFCCSCMTVPTKTDSGPENACHNSKRKECVTKFQSDMHIKSGQSNFKDYSYLDSLSNFLPSMRRTKRTRHRRARDDSFSKRSLTPHGIVDEYSEWLGINIQQPRLQPPDFMVQLFHLLSPIHSDRLKNTVVTSFVNINQQGYDTGTMHHSSKRIYTLVFNGTMAYSHEDVEHAELRIFLSPAADNVPEFQQCLYNVAIYELHAPTSSPESRSLIFSGRRSISANSWNGFDLTTAVQLWDPSSLHVIDVKMDLLSGRQGSGEGLGENQETKMAPGVRCWLKAETDPSGPRDPILVVFSKKVDERRRRQSSRVKRNVFDDKDERKDKFNSANGVDANGDIYDHQNDDQQHSADSKQSEKNTQFNKAVPWVTFIKDKLEAHGQDINLTYIYENLNQRVNESILHKFKSSTKETAGPFHDESAAVMWTHRLRREVRNQRSRHKRHASMPRNRRNRRTRNSCRRQNLYVDFGKIAWHDFVIFPTGYEAFECTGRCYAPISSHLKPTKHAIVQTLFHTSQPSLVSGACCVPTRLEPISILYMKDGVITYEYSYKDMVASECGCR